MVRIPLGCKVGPTDKCGVCGGKINRWKDSFTSKRDRNGIYTICIKCFLDGKRRPVK